MKMSSEILRFAWLGSVIRVKAFFKLEKVTFVSVFQVVGDNLRGNASDASDQHSQAYTLSLSITQFRVYLMRGSDMFLGLSVNSSSL